MSLILPFFYLLARTAGQYHLFIVLKVFRVVFSGISFLDWTLDYFADLWCVRLNGTFAFGIRDYVLHSAPLLKFLALDVPMSWYSPHKSFNRLLCRYQTLFFLLSSQRFVCVYHRRIDYWWRDWYVGSSFALSTFLIVLSYTLIWFSVRFLQPHFVTYS